jgi:hypothetical protein
MKERKSSVKRIDRRRRIVFLRPSWARPFAPLRRFRENRDAEPLPVMNVAARWKMLDPNRRTRRRCYLDQSESLSH